MNNLQERFEIAIKALTDIYFAAPVGSLAEEIADEALEKLKL